MAAQVGRNMVIKLGDGSGPPESFTTVAGLKSTSMTINHETVDVTTKDSAGWRTLLADAGIKSMSMSGSGVFTDSTIEETMRSQSFAGSIDTYQFFFPNGDILEGEFQVTSFENGGEVNGEQTYSLSFESSGVITFTAA